MYFVKHFCIKLIKKMFEIYLKYGLIFLFVTEHYILLNIDCLSNNLLYKYYQLLKFLKMSS